MTHSEFVRWLMRHGVQVSHGKKHLKLYLNGAQSVLPRHPAQELKLGLVQAVKKQLKL